MPGISMSAGRVIMRDGKIGTEHECCCCPCYFESINNYSFCPNLDDPSVTPEFIAAQCASIAACFAALAQEFDAAGYTVTIADFDPGCPSGCGKQITIECDSCASEWSDCAGFGNGPCEFDERFHALPDFGAGCAFLLNFGWEQRCVDGEPGNVLTGGIFTLQDNNGVYYVPICGNPLP